MTVKTDHFDNKMSRSSDKLKGSIFNPTPLWLSLIIKRILKTFSKECLSSLSAHLATSIWRPCD